jgi:hypothetical protein
MNAAPPGGPDDGTSRFPGWARLTLIVLAVVALLFVVMLIVGGFSGHGPQRHTGSATGAVTGAETRR